MFRATINRMVNPGSLVFPGFFEGEDKGTDGGTGTADDKLKTGKEGEDQSGDNGNQNSGKDGNGGNDAGKESGGTGKPPQFTAEQQAHIDKLLGRTRDEERTKAKRESDRKAAEEQGNYKKLYEELKPSADRVPDLEKTISDLSAQVNAVIDSEIEKWPKEIKDMDPGKDDVNMRAEWVKKARAAAMKLQNSNRAPNSEHGGGGNGGGGKTNSKDAAKAFMRSRYPVPGKK